MPARECDCIGAWWQLSLEITLCELQGMNIHVVQLLTVFISSSCSYCVQMWANLLKFTVIQIQCYVWREKHHARLLATRRLDTILASVFVLSMINEKQKKFRSECFRSLETKFLMKHSAHRVRLWWKSSRIFGRISLPSSGDGN